jgi:hypothetical protein
VFSHKLISAGFIPVGKKNRKSRFSLLKTKAFQKTLCLSGLIKNLPARQESATRKAELTAAG